MLLSAPLMATQTQTVACPTDPWGNFMAWLFCDLLQAFGVQTKNLSTDMVASYLHMSVGSGNACAGLVESLGSGSCVTLNLWHATEMAGFPLVVVAMGARFMRMLTQGNYSVSPGWAFAHFIRVSSMVESLGLYWTQSSKRR